LLLSRQLVELCSDSATIRFRSGAANVVRADRTKTTIAIVRGGGGCRMRQAAAFCRLLISPSRQPAFVQTAWTATGFAVARLTLVA
jgi:hypothetical protein